MTTIPAAVERVIKKKPFLESALIEGIVNLSALSRKIKDEIEEELGKKVNDGAIIMALNRLVPRLELISAMKLQKVIENIGDIVVRSNLSDYAYANSKSLLSGQMKLLEKITDMNNDAFCTFSQGVSETTIVVSASLGGMVEEIFAHETLVNKTENLSSITVKLPAENSIYPGVYYCIFKELAWDNINISEVISTTNEFTVLVASKDIQKAFSILMDSKRMFSSNR
ncbi:MAG: aspartate kinase [Rikenellaceae bacterium]|nr:aspartate kinase [Rikenellaceae bacterium]